MAFALDRFTLGPPTQATLDAGVHSDLFSFSVATYPEYLAAIEMTQDILAQQRQVERDLLPEAEDAFHVDGACAICGDHTPFLTSFMYSSPELVDGRVLPNWREHLSCAQSFTNRIRASMHFLQSVIPVRPDDRIYITEQVTPLFQWLRQTYGTVEGSEYLGADLAGGTVVDGIRHEDLCALSFADASFDLAMSFDVVEHVVDFDAALTELARILKPGGRLLMQAPTAVDAYHTIVRARVDDQGEIEHILEPEYHGNPVDPENGALCYRYLGMETLDMLRAAGFRSVHLVHYWSRKYAYFGRSQVLFYAVK